MRLNYSINEFRQDLKEKAILGSLTDEDKSILLTLMDASFEAWAAHLSGITDALTFTESDGATRKITEIICVYSGRAIKIENRKKCATDSIYFYAKDNVALEEVFANFREFIRENL